MPGAFMPMILVAVLLAQTDSPSFTQVIRAQFLAWDQDRDGTLRASEIDLLMNLRSIRGDPAAALAVIKLRQREIGTGPGARFAPTLNELVASAADHEISFQRNRAALATLEPRLFAGDGPDFRVLRQGEIGDCYFLSLTGYLAAVDPGRIVKMIEPRPGGDYRVRFADGEPIEVPAPTDAEMLVNNSASSLTDGHWLPVLEKALGERQRAIAANPELRTGEATDAIASGGSLRTIIRLYSGHRAWPVTLRDPIGAEERRERLRREVPAVLARKMLACVAMDEGPTDQPRVPGLGYRHAYAIVGFEPGLDLVFLWNPWGRDFDPMGPEGPENGFRTRHGVFRVPLAVFDRLFATVYLESTIPADAP